MDLNLLRSEMGTVIMSSAMFDDLVGWILFSLVLGMMNPAAQSGGGVKHTIVLVLVFAGLTLTLGRWLIDKMLPFIQAHTTWPGGVLGFIFTLTLAARGLHRVRRNSRGVWGIHHRNRSRRINPSAKTNLRSIFMKLSPTYLPRSFSRASDCVQISLLTSIWD